jgi:hypothetical protein
MDEEARAMDRKGKSTDKEVRSRSRKARVKDKSRTVG